MGKRKRVTLQATPSLDPFRQQHAALTEQVVQVNEHGRTAVLVNEAESPLAWLYRRRDANGQRFLAVHQFEAGERLRLDFTVAQMMPQMTLNWSFASPRQKHCGAQNVSPGEAAVAARMRFDRAVKATGPEFSGLLIDICCFLKKLDDVERERGWPSRSAKVVLQLGLERLARHYGLRQAA